jgi:hypothetical protein
MPPKKEVFRETVRFLDKPIKEPLVDKNQQDDIYFKLDGKHQISDLIVHLKLEGSSFEEEVSKVANYTFYRSVPERTVIDILDRLDQVSELILNLRFKKDFIIEHAQEGVYVWIST